MIIIMSLGARLENQFYYSKAAFLPLIPLFSFAWCRLGGATADDGALSGSGVCGHAAGHVLGNPGAALARVPRPLPPTLPGHRSPSLWHPWTVSN